VPECPVGAIVADTDVPAGQERFVEMNARYAAQWPVINQAREPLPDAEQWATVSGKLDHLSEPA
jgi:ferredoxin